MTIQWFRKRQLIKTSWFNDNDNLSISDFSKLKSKYDISNTFKEYSIIGLHENNNNSKCKIKLTFSEKNNNLLLVKFNIVDAYVDPRISYYPIDGYYLLEFDNDGNILQSFYIIMIS